MITKLLDIVAGAGNDMKRYYDSAETNVHHKGEIDLVTDYDIAIEKRLVKELSAAFPDFRIIGEESSAQDIGLQPGKVIYIDPIDGTTSFVHRFPFTCISVGVFIDKQPYCGVVHSPILGETYSAVKGEGAFMNGTKRLAVSAVSKPVEVLFCTGFPYDKEQRRKVMPLFNYMVDTTQGARRTGSAALDLCYVARGTFDVYYESQLKPWDIAAGILMVAEAGGTVTDFSGAPHDLSGRFIVATNGRLHSQFLEEMSKYFS